jgi:hypothetical protein
MLLLPQLQDISGINTPWGQGLTAVGLNPFQGFHTCCCCCCHAGYQWHQHSIGPLLISSKALLYEHSQHACCCFCCFCATLQDVSTINTPWGQGLTAVGLNPFQGPHTCCCCCFAGYQRHQHPLGSGLDSSRAQPLPGFSHWAQEPGSSTSCRQAERTRQQTSECQVVQSLLCRTVHLSVCAFHLSGPPQGVGTLAQAPVAGRLPAEGNKPVSAALSTPGADCVWPERMLLRCCLCSCLWIGQNVCRLCRSAAVPPLSCQHRLGDIRI